jgi:hypothetical protein
MYLKMGKDRTFSTAEGLLNDDLDILNNIMYYTGNMLEVRFREILIMDVRMCRKVSNSLSKEINTVDVSSDDDLEKVEYNRVSVLGRCNYVGIIYELSSEYDEKVYIGSTTNLEKRLEGHMLCAYIYDNYKIRYCGSYEILNKKKVNVRIIKSSLYVYNNSMLEDESEEINKRKEICTNIIDPVSHEYISEDRKIGRKERKIYRVDYLYNIGIDMIRGKKLCDDDLVRLKYDLINKCNEEINLKKKHLELNRIYDISLIE